MSNWRTLGAFFCLVILGLSLSYLAFAGPSENEKQGLDLTTFKVPDNTKFRILTFPPEAEVCQPSGQSTRPSLKGYSGTEKPPLDTADFSKLTRVENGQDKEFVRFFVRLDGYQKSETFEVPLNELHRGVWRGGEVLRLTPVSKLREARELFPVAFALVPLSLIGLIVFGILAFMEVRNLKEREQLIGEAGQDPYIGRLVRDYLIKRKLGGGAQGAVYLVRDKSGDELAMKVFENREPKKTDSGFYDDGEFKEAEFEEAHKRYRESHERFLREARIRISHPNVAQVLDAGDEGDFLWLVTPHYKGGTLLSRLTGETLPDATILQYAEDIKNGLEALHQRKITHRDLKPGNIMVDSEGKLVVIDFGLARDKNREKTITQNGVIMGNLPYMAPEQFGEVRTTDERSDQYAYGFLLFEFLTGSLPVPPEAPIGLVSQKKLMEQFARLREFSPDAPEELENVLFTMMRQDKKMRYQNICDAHEAFEKAFRNWKERK